MCLAKSKDKYQEISRTLRLMCDTVPDMIWAKDINMQFIFVNKEVCKTLLNVEDTSFPIGKTGLFFAELERGKHPDVLEWYTFGEICERSDQFVINTKTPGHFEEIGYANGKYLHLSVNKAPIIDETGKMIGIVGCARDVTEHRLLEDKVLHSKLKYRAILDNLQDGFIQTDKDCKICFISISALEILGYTSWKTY
jgi:PAS domain-containing protein